MTKDERREYHRNWHSRNREKFRSYTHNYRIRKFGSVRAYNIVQKYGITLEELNSIIESQGSKCKICGVQFSEENKETKPHVDHNHTTKAVRGVLCSRCNLGLGNFRDSRELLSLAINYLTQ